MTKLYDYWRSSASYRVRIALGLAGEEWDTVVVDLLNSAQRTEDHLARNPQGLVPVLEIDGRRLTQSLAIITYLDETRNLGLLPEIAFDRAQVRALSYAIAMEIHPVCNLNVARWAVDQSGQKISMKGWMQHFITNGLRAYEQMVAEGPFSFGSSVTLADICLVPQAYNAQRWEVDMAQFPRIGGILARLDEIPAFQKAHPDLCPKTTATATATDAMGA